MAENQDFNSIEEIDAFLDGQESVEPKEEATEETSQEEYADPNEVAEEAEEESVADESTAESGNTEVAEQPKSTNGSTSKKPTQEEKQNYAFARLNQERKQFQQQAQHYQDLMNELAQASGYANVADYEKAIRSRLDEFHAKQRGISSDVYNQLRQQEQQIRQLQSQRNTEAVRERANAFQNAVNQVKKQYGFNDEDINGMFQNLQDAGYTVQSLLSMPSPELVVRGALADKISERKLQKAKAQMDSVKVDSGKLNTSSSAKGYSEDDELNAEIARWEKQGYIDQLEGEIYYGDCC